MIRPQTNQAGKKMSANTKQKRISANDAALLLIDHQTGLSNGVNDMTLPEFHNNVSALAKLGKLFQLPTVITASAPNGPNGPVLPQITKILPEVQIIARPGEINPWDNPQFLEAVKKTGKTQIIMLTPDEKAAMKKALLPVHKENEARVTKELIAEVYKATGFKP